MEPTRQSVLRKLRIYSNEVVAITERLDTGEIELNEAERLLIALDERIADRLLGIDDIKNKTTH